MVALAPAASARQMALGVSITDGQPDTDKIETALDDFVAHNNGIQPAIYSVWSQWGSPATKGFPADTLQMLHDRGIQGMVWWEPIDPANPDKPRYSRHKRTLAGVNDDYIKKWARDARDFGQANDTQIILRFAHEANGTWFPWVIGYRDNTATTFKKYWRYVWWKFKGQGALPYVKFLWSVTNRACKGCNPYKNIFPGKKFVDYVGVTAFNWGAQRQWKPMVKQLEKPLQRLKAVAGWKPVIIAELASHWKPRSKAKWIKNGYNKTYKLWARVKAIMYLDSSQPKEDWGHPDWRLRRPWDGSAQQAYAEISAKWRFKGSLVK